MLYEFEPNVSERRSMSQSKTAPAPASNPARQSVRIRKITAREILDSRGLPTVEVDLYLDSQKHPGELVLGRAAVPSGASTGENEALELRDSDRKRFLGKGVQKAVGHIQDKIAPVLLNQEFARQTLLDDRLRDLDGSPNKSNLGANAILAVSMAFARAHAAARDVPLFQHLAQIYGTKGNLLPVPLVNILNGGQHADNGLDIQEFMIVPIRFERFSDALQAAAEVFQCLKKILKSKNLSTSVGDEGGFAPVFSGAEPHGQALSAVIQAISDAGYRPGKDIYLALDAASSEFAEKSTTPSTEIHYQFEGKRRTSKEMIHLYSQWLDSYPILSMEDALSERDWMGWAKLTEFVGKKCQLVGDDLFVTNPEFLKKGIEQKTANSVLIKLNQIGTVTETLETMKMAQQNGYSCIVSHRSGETEDTFIADLAVGAESTQIKTGSICRTDRTAKYNQLLRIEELLGNKGTFAGPQGFKGLS